MLDLELYNGYWAFSFAAILSIICLALFGIILILDRCIPAPKNAKHITKNDILNVILVFICIIIIGGIISGHSLFRDYVKEINEAKLFYNQRYYENGSIEKAKAKIIKDIFEYDYENIWICNSEDNYKHYLINLYEQYIEKGLSKHDAYKFIYIENSDKRDKYVDWVNKKIQQNLNFNFNHITEEYKLEDKQ